MRRTFPCQNNFSCSPSAEDIIPDISHGVTFSIICNSSAALNSFLPYVQYWTQYLYIQVPAGPCCWFGLKCLFFVFQSRTPALVFEHVNNTDFKVGVNRFLSCGSVLRHRWVSLLKSKDVVLVYSTCTRPWQIMTSASTCTRSSRWVFWDQLPLTWCATPELGLQSLQTQLCLWTGVPCFYFFLLHQTLFWTSVLCLWSVYDCERAIR